MEIVITIRKEVPDRDEAMELYNTVKEKVTDVPGLRIGGNVSNHFEQEVTPE